MNPINQNYALWRSSDGALREAALRELYKHVFRQALAAIYEVLKRERMDLAADATSTTLLKIYQFRGDSTFSTWAYRIAHNLAISEARKLNSRREAQLLDEELLESPEKEDLSWLLEAIGKVSSLTPQEHSLLQAVALGLRPQDWAKTNGLSRMTGWRLWKRVKARLGRAAMLK